MAAEKTLIQWYSGNVLDCKPKGTVYLDKLFKAIEKPKFPDHFDNLRAAKEAGNVELYFRLKTQLPSFTPAVIIKNWRNKQNIIRFTGIFVLDYDKLTPAEAIGLRDFLFTTYSVLFAAWLSASGRGVRAMVKIPRCKTDQEFKEYYYAIEYEFGQYSGFDTRIKNSVQPMFFSYDPNIKWRSDPDTWTERRDPPKSEPVTAPLPELSQVSDQELNFYRNVAMKGLKTSYQRITDIGHPLILSIARRAGGFIGSGLFSIDEILPVLDNWIESHYYLREKAATYKKTVRWAVSEGIKAPIVPTI